MMEKYLYILFIVLLLSSCFRPMNMNTVLKEANFIGIVDGVNEGSILVKMNKDEDESPSSDLISVSLDVELKDSMKYFKVGDEICVYYDGNIAETYPAQIKRVYAIISLDPWE